MSWVVFIGYIIGENFACAEIRTHNFLTNVVLLQQVAFIRIVWLLSDLTSWATSGGQYSRRPGHR